MKQVLFITAITLSVVGSQPCTAAELQLMDFAEGIEIAATDKPLLELSLPDKVYTTVSHWDLSDLRVFNSDGIVVPHAFCFAQPISDTINTVSVPVYGMKNINESDNHNSWIILRTADGAQLDVHTSDTNSSEPMLRPNARYVLDVREVKQPIQAVQLDWATLEGTSEIAVRVLASDDLSHWRSILDKVLLLHVTASDQLTTLEQSRIALPVTHYQYLRIESFANNVILNIKQARVEYNIPAPAIEPTWFSAGAPHADEDADELRYESTRRVPISFIRVLPNIANSSLQVSVQSRGRTDTAWQTKWSGEVHDTHFNNQSRSTAPIAITPTTARYWRLLFPEGSELPTSTPQFDLGYQPVRLQFLAQGSGPYILTYGSSHAVPASALACDSLLSNMSGAEKQQVLGVATLGITKLLAGHAALRTTRELPTRTLVLWGILLIGVGAIASLALSLLKRSERREWD